VIEPDTWPAVAERLDAAALRGDLEAALDQLPARRREAVHMRVVEELDDPELASVPYWETMSESFPRSTVAVFTGGSCAAGLACSAFTVATTPAVAAAATRTTAAATAQVFRLTP
jgi:hypothetical protein